MKKTLYLIISIILIFAMIPVSAYADTLDGYTSIYDYADLFDEDEEEEVAEYINDLYYSELGMDVVVLTADTYEGSIETYTDDFFDTYTSSYDGILIFVNNDEVYLNTVGYAVIAINDYEVEDILDAGWDDFLDYDFVSCVEKMASEASDLIELAYENGYTDSSIITNIHPPEPSTWELLKEAAIPTPGSLIVSIIVTVIVVVMLINKHKSVSKAVNAKEYLGGNFSIVNTDTRYLGTRETVDRNYYKPSDSSSSSGSRSHSSGSSRRSSGGRSHGGGGRKR